MATIVDAGPIVAAATENDERGRLCRAALRTAQRPLIVPAPVTAEVDYLLGKRGPDVAHRFLADIAAGRFLVECLEPSEYVTVMELSARYRGFGPGLADLSVVVLAHRYGTQRVLTTDGRHFRQMTTLDGMPFVLLPSDG